MIKTTRLIGLLIGLCLCFSLYASDDISQTAETRNRLSLHIGGVSALSSLEYQHQLLSSGKHGLFASASMGMTLGALSFPIGINYSYGKTNQMFVGFSFNPIMYSLTNWEFDLSDPHTFSWSIRAGFCKYFNLRNNRAYVMVYFAPFIDETRIYPWGGIGFGTCLY